MSGIHDARQLADHNTGHDPQELADKGAVRDLAVLYCSVLDQRDWERLADVFVPEATATLPSSGLVRGCDEIVSRCRRGLSRLDSTRHTVSDHEIAVDGDAATHRCRMNALHVRRDAPGGSDFTIGGRYEDQLIRTPHGWRIRHRELVVTWTEGNPRVLRPRTGSYEPSEQPAATQQNQHGDTAEHPRTDHGGRVGPARRRGGVARLHPDGRLRGLDAGHCGAGRGQLPLRHRRTPLPRRNLVAVGDHPGPRRR